MRQTLAQIHAIETIGPYQRIRFLAPELAPALEPGRPILASQSQAYLGRTWWPCAIESAGFAVLMNSASASRLRIGDQVDLIGPIGRGFKVNETSRNLLLIAAGADAPDPDLGPLLPLVDRALAEGRSVTLAYAAPTTEQAYPVWALSRAIEVIRAIDADLIDLLAPDAIVWADQVFTCGSIEFTTQLTDRIRAIRFPLPNGFAQALHPASLPCGVGACGACWQGAQLACVDGPVFELNERPVRP
ncbi:MAG TPA: hypothetical protein VJG32_06780 [Anaerolineae bacterium]|nr:hypothetical protein [Anaerolineae bacterium]